MMLPRRAVIDRAELSLGRKTTYRLSRGGYDPSRDTAGSECDCSGFVAWCLGVPRKFAPIGWIETTKIVQDAIGKQLIFCETRTPEPGDLVVYGDWYDPAVQRQRQGHCGILVVAPQECRADWWDAALVIHCSQSNKPNAIARTNARAFRGRSVFCRPVEWPRRAEG